MLKNLFEEQRKALGYFFDHVDSVGAHKILEALAGCQGIIFFTGIGKSSLIAKKVATTMNSIGIKALYLSPTNALHGDIGILSKDDIFVIFSKSGETEELLHLIPFLRNKGVFIISLVCQKESRLQRASDLSFVLPLEKELGPFELVPTTSSSIQLIFGDILAVGMIELKQIQIEQYRLNHPSGQIGKRTTLKVKDLMVQGKDTPLAAPTTALKDCIVELSEKKCGCLLIVDETTTLLGIFTDGDLRRALQKYGTDALNMNMESLMTLNPRSTDPEMLAYNAMRVMEEDQKRPITAMPVLSEDHKVLGLIKMHDIIQSGV